MIILLVPIFGAALTGARRPPNTASPVTRVYWPLPSLFSMLGLARTQPAADTTSPLGKLLEHKSS
jgi:hypothetical protein